MITLYGAMASRAHRVVWLLNELGLAYRHVPTPFLDGSTRQPEFLAINPNGRVPALDDDGLLLCESLSINLYLAKQYGGGGADTLAARDLREDTLATQWSLWVVTEVEKLLLASAHRKLFNPEGRDERSPRWRWPSWTGPSRCWTPIWQARSICSVIASPSPT